MMTGPFLIAAMCVVHPTFGFVRQSCVSSMRRTTAVSSRLFLSSSSSSSASSSSRVSVDQCVSRLATLQTLLSRWGAPGSTGCGKPNDLQAVASSLLLQEASDNNTPELVSSLSGPPDDEELVNLHPYLFPIAKSKSSGNFICAYRNPSVEESDKTHPWPIVESTLNGPGMKLLALNSEHLMRRIACESDGADGGDNDGETESEIVAIYNKGLGKGLLRDKALDAPYHVGEVAKLGYGVDKYVLLRVGPFADLYQSMSQQHAAKGDEQSSLIAAEAANGKLAGFASNYRFYSQMLSTFPNREEEARDAARMCLRLPLPTIGLSLDDFHQVAVLAQVADKSDSTQDALVKLRELYDKIRDAESEDDHDQGKTEEQIAIDEANFIIDDATLSGKPWNSIREQVGEKFRSVGRNEFATFVDFKTM